MFSESSPCLLGQHGSCCTAQRPGELSEHILQNRSHDRMNNPALYVPVKSDHLLLLVLVVVHLSVLGELAVGAGRGRDVLAAGPGDAVGGVVDVLAGLGVAAHAVVTEAGADDAEGGEGRRNGDDS